MHLRTPIGFRGAVAGLGLTAALLLPGVALGSPAGDLDPSFDRDGRRLLTDIQSAAAVLVQKDGKLLFTGQTTDGRFRVVQLDADGARDQGFGTQGAAVADFGGEDRALAAALQADGKIVVAGQSRTQNTIRPVIARFTREGSLDPTFDPGGADGDGRKILAGTAIQSEIKVVLVQPDGKLVLAGDGYGDGKPEMAVVRLTRGGAVDGTTYARGTFASDAHVKAAALTAGGDLVVAGDVAGPDRSKIALARFGPDGELVDTFGKAGTKVHDSGQNELVSAVLEQPDGKLVVAGTTGTTEQQMAATRFDRDGAPDGSFGDEGRALPGYDGLSGTLAATLQPDGKILIAGIAGPPYDFAIARLGAGGALDPSFGSAGRATVDFSGVEAATAIALQPDGRAVVAGTSAEFGAPVARLQADPPATPDPGAGGDDGAGGGGGQPGGGAVGRHRAGARPGHAGPAAVRGRASRHRGRRGQARHDGPLPALGAGRGDAARRAAGQGQAPQRRHAAADRRGGRQPGALQRPDRPPGAAARSLPADRARRRRRRQPLGGPQRGLPDRPLTLAHAAAARSSRRSVQISRTSSPDASASVASAVPTASTSCSPSASPSGPASR